VISQMSQNMKQRLVFGTLAGIFIFIAIYFSHVYWFKPIFTFLMATLVSTALWEYDQIARAKGFHPRLWIGILSTFGFAFALLISSQNPAWRALPEASLALTLAATFLVFFRRGSQPLVNMALTLFGILYLTLPLSTLISINYFFKESVQDGRWWLFYLIGVTKMTDIGAFIFGKNWGKHPLAPYISPKKTWEGAYGGILVGVITSFVLYLAASLLYEKPPISLTLFESLWLGALLSMAAQLGDLAESLLKRDGGIKDSNQLPGLGGVLDILDSLVFTAPLLYIFLKETSYDYYY
jgi:phosphatidate cytidylyltransferase